MIDKETLDNAYVALCTACVDVIDKLCDNTVHPGYVDGAVTEMCTAWKYYTQVSKSLVDADTASAVERWMSMSTSYKIEPALDCGRAVVAYASKITHPNTLDGENTVKVENFRMRSKDLTTDKLVQDWIKVAEYAIRASKSAIQHIAVSESTIRASKSAMEHVDEALHMLKDLKSWELLRVVCKCPHTDAVIKIYNKYALSHYHLRQIMDPGVKVYTTESNQIDILKALTDSLIDFIVVTIPRDKVPAESISVYNKVCKIFHMRELLRNTKE